MDSITIINKNTIIDENLKNFIYIDKYDFGLDIFVKFKEGTYRIYKDDFEKVEKTKDKHLKLDKIKITNKIRVLKNINSETIYKRPSIIDLENLIFNLNITKIKKYRNVYSLLDENKKLIENGININKVKVNSLIENNEIIKLNNYEEKIYSQNGEDGITKKIINLIYENPYNKKYVEFGVENGMECNTRILREKYNWNGLLMDGSNENLDINLKKEFITKENIVSLFEKYEVNKNLNLLCIDIDYNDFYVLQEILKNNYNPDIIISEYNGHYKPNEDKIVMYREKHMFDATDYFGASLLCFTKLCNMYNYSLVCCDSTGVNSFFIRNDLIQHKFWEINNVEKLWFNLWHGPYRKGLDRYLTFEGQKIKHVVNLFKNLNSIEIFNNNAIVIITPPRCMSYYLYQVYSDLFINHNVIKLHEFKDVYDNLEYINTLVISYRNPLDIFESVDNLEKNKNINNDYNIFIKSLVYNDFDIFIKLINSDKNKHIYKYEELYYSKENLVNNILDLGNKLNYKFTRENINDVLFKYDKDNSNRIKFGFPDHLNKVYPNQFLENDDFFQLFSTNYSILNMLGYIKNKIKHIYININFQDPYKNFCLPESEIIFIENFENIDLENCVIITDLQINKNVFIIYHKNIKDTQTKIVNYMLQN